MRFEKSDSVRTYLANGTVLRKVDEQRDVEVHSSPIVVTQVDE